MSDPTDLYALAADLLDASVEALGTIPGFNPFLDGAPDRAFVSPGQPALDCCDQLTVYVHSIGEGTTGPGGNMTGRRNVTGRVNLVGLTVTIARCVPMPDAQGNPPSAVDLGAAAEQTSADAWALWNHLWNLWRAGALFSMCGEVFWDGMRPLTPDGGCGGWNLVLRVSLDGYEETIGS